jgi:hypothetical protein
MIKLKNKMKVITITVAFTFFVLATSFGQYKKASFLNKEGRTHELGTGFSFIPNGGGTPVKSVFYSSSVEGQKSISLFYDLEFMTKGKFSFAGNYYDANTGGNATKQINGKSGMYILLKYGAQYRFIKPENTEETKLVPYVKLGLLVGFGLGIEDKLKDKDGNSYNRDDVTPILQTFENLYGIEAGAGVSYYITKKIAIRFGANYRQVILGRGFTEEVSGEDVFNIFKSHPSLSLSLKYRIFSDGD